MSVADEAQIAGQIELAYVLAEGGAMNAAAHAFASARSLVLEAADSTLLGQRLVGHSAGLTRERISYCDMISAKRTASKKLLVLADSLGLPRPEEKTGTTAGANQTYPMMLLDTMPEHQVESHCQRYFTSLSVLALLRSDPSFGESADVVLHVGLNDAATRMFLETQRIALDFLSPEVKDRIVGFAQRYRRALLAELPALHYVEPSDFTANLEATVELLRERSARRIALTTIILPPERFWSATPGLNSNFADYNLRIMQVAARTGAVLFDLDRLVWSRQHESVLLDDGMHLSAGGHRLFAAELAKLLT